MSDMAQVPVRKVMNRTTLAFALAIQLAIVAVLLAVRSGDVEVPAPFLNFDAAAVDSLSVGNAEGEVALSKAGDAWLLADGAPADSSKVEEVIGKLADAAPGWPVATSASAAERFEVVEGDHQRQLVLKAGDETVADVYLGTSPGYRKTHARRSDDDDVYAITFSNFEAGVKASDWLDKALLQVAGSVRSLRRVGGFALAKDEDGSWQAKSGAEIDQGKATTLAGRFTGLTVLGIADAALPDEPAATFVLADDDGELTFKLFQLEEGEYAATTDRVPGAYEISSYTAEQMDVALADIAPDPPPDAILSEDADVSEDADLSEDAAPSEDGVPAEATTIELAPTDAPAIETAAAAGDAGETSSQ